MPHALFSLLRVLIVSGVLLLLSCAGRWQQPRTPLLAVPLNMTAGYSMWRNMDTALSWAKEWVKGKPLFTKAH
jgi:hypothetical protein